jgi:chromosome segregation ATPase
MDDAEAQMRRALGLNGGMRSRPEPERGDQPSQSRMQDRFSPAHRRRFVQDGDVQVAYVRQPDPAARQPVQASPLAARLQRVETTLAAETAARQLAERTLTEAQTTIRDLRTKLGHADLARNEATEALRRDRENQAAARAEFQEQIARQQEAEDRLKTLQRDLSAAQTALQEERGERKALEKALRAAEEARETAERLVRVLSEEEAAATATVTTLASRRPAKASPKAAAPVAVEETEEPEPVKWWLSGANAKRR